MALAKRLNFDVEIFMPLVVSGCRSLIGLLWLASLRWKLPPTFAATGDHRSLLEWMELQVAHPTIGLYADFVSTIVIPNFIIFAWLTFIVELLVGLSLVTGFMTRWGAFLGGLWSLNLAIGLISVPGEWPWSYLMLMMWHGLFWVSVSQQKFGLDALFKNRRGA